MNRAYLGLGSNMGDKKGYIDSALELLEAHEKINIVKISSYYETEPVGYKEQDWFLNIVAEINTELDPHELLKYCMEVEQKLNRKRIIRWGPRTIDIDILLYNDYNLNKENLIIPHPRMTERAFVMIPLYEIAPDILLNGEQIENIINKLKSEEIRKMEYGK